jgi:hypothetical protein
MKRLISHLPIQLFDAPIHHNSAEKIPWLEFKLIFFRKRLNSECDVLISFNTHHKERGVSRAVKAVPGLKIWHVGDYFWNEPASKINKRLENMCWNYSVNLENGLEKTYKWYLEEGL